MNIAANELRKPVARRRRKNKSECLYDDLAEQIHSGSLKPGERLATYRELSELYGVSQGIITEALKRLIKDGLVETRNRSHCFVRETLPQYASTETPANNSLDGWDDKRNTITIYNSETFAASLILWQQVIAEFNSKHPELDVTILSGLDGTLPEILQHCQPDLVISSESTLMRLSDRYVSPPDINILGLRTTDFLTSVQQRIGQPQELHGIPFSLTTHYLFANVDLIEQSGIELTPPSSLEHLFEMASDVEDRLADGHHGLLIGYIHDLLLLNGAYSYVNGQFVFCESKARQCFELIRRHHFAYKAPRRILECFETGKLAFMFHCSFQAVNLFNKSPFKWKLLSLASDPDTPPNAVLCLMSMCRQTRHPQQCLALMEYLCSDKVQTAFGCMHGNVPVLKNSALSPEMIEQHPFPGVYRETIENSLVWPDDVLQTLTRCSALDLYFYNGEITVDEAVARLRFSLELAFPTGAFQ